MYIDYTKALMRPEIQVRRQRRRALLDGLSGTFSSAHPLSRPAADQVAIQDCHNTGKGAYTGEIA